MDYNNKNWTNGEVIYAADLNHIENGVKEASDNIGNINTTISSLNITVNGILNEFGSFTGTVETNLNRIDANVAAVSSGLSTVSSNMVTISSGLNNVVHDVSTVQDNTDLLIQLSIKEATVESWQPGKLSTSTGTIGSSAQTITVDGIQFQNRYGIRTKTYLPKYIQYIKTKNTCYPFLFAYDNNGAYIGIWDGTAFGTAYISSTNMQALNIGNLNKLYPTYQYRLVIIDTTATSAISAENVGNILMNYVEYDTLISDKDLYGNYDDNISLSMFESIGIIGDSWASGEIHNPNTTTHELLGTYYNVSWGKIMGRSCGIDITCYSKGGATTKSWLTENGHGLPALLADTPKNLYIINLGINDKKNIYGSSPSETLGSSNDIDTTDYTQNADTFYGNYGKIIGNILAHAPNAKIVCVSVMRKGERIMDANIQEIAQIYGVPFIDVTEDFYFTSALSENSICNGHPLAYGYAGIAKSMERLLKQSIINNPAYFGNYTGYIAPASSET